MMAHWVYLKYMIRHKWFVFLECCKLDIPWLGFIHDWSKFLPSEWFPYVHSFYNPDGSCRDVRDETGCYDPGRISEEFDCAWLSHIHRNKHHWQHWLLVQDEDEDKVLRMPNKYAREMVADWRGAGKAKTGKDNTLLWYTSNGNKMQLHPDVRAWIEAELALWRGGYM